jgi:hypothetical protein
MKRLALNALAIALFLTGCVVVYFGAGFIAVVTAR